MRRILLLLAVAVLLLAAGCDSGQTAPGAGQSGPVTAATAPIVSTAPIGAAANPSAGPGAPQPVLASSELVVGQNRFVLGLLDSNTGKPIEDVPQVSLQLFKVHDDGTATKVGDANTVYHGENLPAGLFVAHPEFKEPGKWGALITVRRANGQPTQSQLNFNVVERGTVPMVGDPAPMSRNLTVKDVRDQGEICSAVPRDDMHELTIADSVKSSKPTLVLFAAPGFCPSFTCGPDLEMTQKIEAKYRGKANFIHIESPNEIQNHTHTGPVDSNHHQDPGHQGVWRPQVQTADEWGLKTEPWIFLVDKNGKITDRFEGGLTIDEVEPAFQKLIQ